MNEAQIDINQGASAELVTRQRELQKQLNARAAAQPLLLIEDATSEQNAESNKEIEETTRALLEVEAQIRRQSPHYAALTQPQAFSFKEIQATLDANTVLLGAQTRRTGELYVGGDEDRSADVRVAGPLANLSH